MECSIRLEFHGESPQLMRAEVRRENGALLTSMRGKTAGAVLGAGSFQWTNAVRALCAIFLKGATMRGNSSALRSSASLSGYGGSLAATLDYALSKEPLWTIDMFGVDISGHAFLRRLLLRTNRERKYPGPVIVALNSKLMRPDDIEIWWNDIRLESSPDVEKLLYRLEKERPEAACKEERLARCA